MPSIEFRAIPASECPPYAQYFQRACSRWQTRHDIYLPTRAYLATRFGLANAKSFTDVYTGKFIPPPQTILQIARECGDSIEEHLTVANADLARRHRPPYDSFAGLMRFVEYHMAQNAGLRHWHDLLQMTQDPAWLGINSKWRNRAEEILVLTIPTEQKIKLIVDALEELQTGGHAPPGQKRLAARA